MPFNVNNSFKYTVETIFIISLTLRFQVQFLAYNKSISSSESLFFFGGGAKGETREIKRKCNHTAQAVLVGEGQRNDTNLLSSLGRGVAKGPATSIESGGTYCRTTPFL